MDPFTIMMLVGLGTSAAGSLIGGISGKDALDAHAKQDRENAQIAEEAAKQAEAQGEAQATQYSQKLSGLEGQQIASAAASGVDVNASQNVQSIQQATQTLSAQDQATIRANAAMTAWGYRMREKQFNSQANQESMQGQFAMVGSLLGGLGQGAGTANQYFGR